MKVRLIKPVKIGKRTFQPGWVIGVDEPTGKRIIEQGDGKAANPNARELKYEVDQKENITCVAPADEVSWKTELPQPQAEEPKGLLTVKKK